jgi:ribonuclease BN (tRNA processing enzyme)
MKNEKKGFKITTLGSGAPPQNLNRSAPSTLVQYSDKHFLVDAGYGASNQLLKAGINPREIKNVLFTHLHTDHTLDYGYFLIVGWHDGRRELNLVGPPSTKKIHDLYIEMYEKDITYRAKLGISLKGIKEDVNILEIDGSDEFELDGVKISTLHVPHTAYTLAYKFEAEGKKLVVSGDLMYNEAFIEFAKASDILVLDANQANSKFLQERGPNFVANLEKSHATIPQIAELAEKANAKKIVLTHLTPGAYIGELVKTVCNIYNGEIEVAEDLLEVCD